MGLFNWGGDKHTDTSGSDSNYHANSQRFIKSAHSQGRKVTAEGPELIAGNRGTYSAPRPKEKIIPAQGDVLSGYNKTMNTKGGTFGKGWK